jgi:hypothetical protein
MTIKKRIIRFLIAVKILKPFTLYKGKKVTRFKHDRNVFFREYILILHKVSKLNSSKRAFVVDQVESWLFENNINLQEFKNELRN